MKHSLQPAPIRISIDSFDPSTGEIQATVKMWIRRYGLEDDHIRFLLLEDDLGGRSTRATRQIINDSISLMGIASSVTFNKTFDIDPSWDVENLNAVVYVQLKDKEVIQVASTRPVATHNVRALIPFDQVSIGPSNPTVEGEEFSVMNVGAADSYTVSLVIDEASPGWTVGYAVGNGSETSGVQDITLDTFEKLDLRCSVHPASPGSITYHLEFASNNLENPLVVPFSYVSNDADILIVDDDGGEDHEQFFAEALGGLGKSYAIWDRSAAPLPAAVAESYSLIVWNTGAHIPTLTDVDRDFLRQHLDAGNSLFLSGQHVAWDLNRNDGNKDPFFMWNYLHALFLTDEAGDHDLVGVDHDPVSDGMTLRITGGDGADNQINPTEMKPYGKYARGIFNYLESSSAGAIRSHNIDTGACLVYLGFGLEGIDNATDRATLMQRSLDWLELCHTNPLGQPAPRRSNGRH